MVKKQRFAPPLNMRRYGKFHRIKKRVSKKRKFHSEDPM